MFSEFGDELGIEDVVVDGKSDGATDDADR